MRHALVLATCLFAAGAAAAQEQIFTPGDAVSLPMVVREVKPAYTEAAREAGIQGLVVLSTVVKADGTVGDVKVIESLDPDHGLDNQAVEAMKQWTFKPGTRDGKPVAVRVAVEMRFMLK
jgi:protein TonB